MAGKNKTAETKVNVIDFINAFADNAQKKEDSLRLIKLMKQWSGCEPKMWGPSMIGFGKYHYQYESGHQGDIFVIGFSPRKAAFSLYVMDPESDNKKLLDKLGKFKMSKACIYFKRLQDLNLDILEMLCKSSIKSMQKKHGDAIILK